MKLYRKRKQLGATVLTLDFIIDIIIQIKLFLLLIASHLPVSLL